VYYLQSRSQDKPTQGNDMNESASAKFFFYGMAIAIIIASIMEVLA